MENNLVFSVFNPTSYLNLFFFTYYHRGEIAHQIVQDISGAGGQMTLEDLAGYQVERRQPLKTTVNKLQMMSTPPPGSGALISLALKIMEKFKWTPENQYKDQDLLFHNMIEALKYAYAPQTFMGDPNFTKNTDEVRKLFSICIFIIWNVNSDIISFAFI